MLLVVLGESSIYAESAEGALHNPELEQNGKAFDVVVAADYLDFSPKGREGPLDEFACLCVVCPDEFETGECLPEGLEN